MHVHPSQINGVDAATQHETARTDAQSRSGGVSFAEQLASASSKAKSSSAPKAPKGEKTEAVTGHSDYRDIVAGPRDGMFLNTSGNKRNGEAFVLVKRHGIEYHIYGTGKHRQVIELKPHKHHTTTPPASTAPTTTPSSGTTDTSSTPTSSATQSTPSA